LGLSVDKPRVGSLLTAPQFDEMKADTVREYMQHGHIQCIQVDAEDQTNLLQADGVKVVQEDSHSVAYPTLGHGVCRRADDTKDYLEVYVSAQKEGVCTVACNVEPSCVAYAWAGGQDRCFVYSSGPYTQTAGKKSSADCFVKPFDTEVCLSWNITGEADSRQGGTSPISGSMPSGFNVVKEYITEFDVPDSPLFPRHRGTKVYDIAMLAEKMGECWMVFPGANDDADFIFSMFQPTPTELWGIAGLHMGIAMELHRLVAEMDFAEIRTTCPRGLTVAGHSMGGGMAQLFALLLTRHDDPLEANINLNKLYTFGTTLATSETFTNDQSADGCFPGVQMWVALPTGNPTMPYAADIVAHQVINAGGIYKSVNSNKVFVAPTGQQTQFPCGSSLPNSMDLLDFVGDTTYWPLHASYGLFSGCLSMPQ